MKVKEIMERSGFSESGSTGRALAYIKDALEEINMLSESHIETVRIDINKDQRFYKVPNNAVRIIDIACKNHLNTDNTYKSIPRMTYKPDITDSDNI